MMMIFDDILLLLCSSFAQSSCNSLFLQMGICVLNQPPPPPPYPLWMVGFIHEWRGVIGILRSSRRHFLLEFSTTAKEAEALSSIVDDGGGKQKNMKKTEKLMRKGSLNDDGRNEESVGMFSSSVISVNSFFLF
jgi:hypothetical protein